MFHGVVVHQFLWLWVSGLVRMAPRGPPCDRSFPRSRQGWGWRLSLSAFCRVACCGVQPLPTSDADFAALANRRQFPQCPNWVGWRQD
eukprot:scaffold243483_cov30-Tisochrysis_lutea.AAC.1